MDVLHAYVVNGRISGLRTVNSAIELGQAGGCEHVEAVGD
jgi:hypothetical protein